MEGQFGRGFGSVPDADSCWLLTVSSYQLPAEPSRRDDTDTCQDDTDAGYHRRCMITRIQHVALDVTDLDEAIHFYRDVLKFKVDDQRPDALGDTGVWLDVGDTQIHLLKTETVSPSPGNHIAFEVRDIHATVAHIVSAGVEVTGPFDLGAGSQAFLHDPAGNLLEMNQPTATEP